MNLHSPNVPADLGEAIERVVARIIREGHYATRDEVLRAGVMALDNIIAESAALHAPLDGPDLGDDEEAIREGLADIEAGRVVDAEEMFDRLLKNTAVAAKREIDLFRACRARLGKAQRLDRYRQ